MLKNFILSLKLDTIFLLKHFIAKQKNSAKVSVHGNKSSVYAVDTCVLSNQVKRALITSVELLFFTEGSEENMTKY